jgi:hypothetical protein
MEQMKDTDPAPADVEKVSAVVAAEGWHADRDNGVISEPPTVATVPEQATARATGTATDLVPSDESAELSTVHDDRLDRAFERESSRRRERFLYIVVLLFALAIVVPIASIGVRVAMTAPTYMAPLLIQPAIVLSSVWIGGRLSRQRRNPE